jgi:hypothetical protein
MPGMPQPRFDNFVICGPQKACPSWYDSTFGANHAMQLDWRLKTKEIKAWDEQFPVRIENLIEVVFLKEHPDYSYVVVK